MKSNLLMDFSADRETGTINVKREFAAPRQHVWAAWTQSELLDQWWAPKPWKAETKAMDFSEGGMWLYAMVGPDGEKHWARNDYKTITAPESFAALDAFCDENGNVNMDFPRAKWHSVFTEQDNGTTLVTIQTKYDKPEDLEQVLAMGMQEGFTAALENLDELLRSQS